MYDNKWPAGAAKPEKHSSQNLGDKVVADTYNLDLPQDISQDPIAPSTGSDLIGEGLGSQPPPGGTMSTPFGDSPNPPIGPLTRPQSNLQASTFGGTTAPDESVDESDTSLFTS